jgi:acetyl-CoA acyltransferase
MDRVNVNGGAIALGHPLGCTGAKLTAGLIQELIRRKARYGIVTMCVGGGMGAAGIFENLNYIGESELKEKVNGNHKPASIG